MNRKSLPLIAVLILIPTPVRADEPATGAIRSGIAPDQPSKRTGSKADQPPRKVVVGTVIYGPYGRYPGLDERLGVLAGLVDEMADQAAKQFPGRGIDLAILPESAVTPTSGPAAKRAIPLKGPVQATFSSLARKHKTYLLVPFDLAEEGSSGPICSNAAVLFDRQGEAVGVYRKAHPVAWVGSEELEGGIAPGQSFPVFHCDFGKLGVQICWDMQFDDGWEALAEGGAEIVAWPTASPATVLPAGRAARHRYYVVSSTWRSNATIYEPTGMVAARVQPPGKVLIHQIDLSFAVLGWTTFLRDGEVLREKYGEKVGFHYDPTEDMGLFWSNDPKTTIGEMVRSIGDEELDAQVERNRRLQDAARGAGASSRIP
jgi:predicted amidohydrolase